MCGVSFKFCVSVISMWYNLQRRFAGGAMRYADMHVYHTSDFPIKQGSVISEVSLLFKKTNTYSAYFNVDTSGLHHRVNDMAPCLPCMGKQRYVYDRKRAVRRTSMLNSEDLTGPLQGLRGP